MGRVKVPPRVAQPDPERSTVISQARAVSSTSNDHKTISNKGSDEEVNHANKKPVLPKKPTIAETEQPRIQERSAAKNRVNVEKRIALNTMTCPYCNSTLPNMGIQEFREHVESCSRPNTGDSESTISSLSPPPESHHGDDADDESVDLDHLRPYVAGELTLYPTITQVAAGNGDLEPIDAQPRISLRKLTDLQKFIDSLEDLEDLPYDVAFNRVQNGSEALIQWQNEWMDLDRYIEIEEPVGPTAKAHKNPRIPKDSQTGLAYREELESFVYGFDYQYHHKQVGLHAANRQRHANGASGGRELRQRVPTQKAAEADLSTSPDSDGGIGTRRRGRAQKLREGTTDLDLARGRGHRARNDSRVDSQSRDQTPVSTFPSGKKRGRPAKPKVGGAARLQELQREGGYDYESTPEQSDDQRAPKKTENSTLLTGKRGFDSHENVATTENWQDDTEQEELASRPSTSDSAMTGLSDDLRNPHVRLSGRARKRQNTSDFEEELPAHKRIRKTTIPTTNGFSDVDLAFSAKDINNAEKTRNTRRNRQEDDILAGDVAATEGALDDSTPRSQDGDASQEHSVSKSDNNVPKSQRERKIITLKTPNGKLRTPTNAVLAGNAATDPIPGNSMQQDGKDGPKVSRASLNMMRRWAAKKQAEALGLPVPKIGRYPKGGSAPLTPDVTTSPDPISSTKPLGGRKRKRDEEELSTANIGLSDSLLVDIEAPTVGKNRGGRPKKITNMQSPNVALDGQHNISEEVQPNPVSDKLDIRDEQPIPEVAAKRKGGRPRKKPVDIESPVLGVQQGLQHIEQADNITEDNIGRANDAESGIPIQDDKHIDEDHSGEQPQLRRTTRVRRQTSAALSASSQANTRRSGRSSQNSTVTPTPAPSQQVGEETIIKQEAGPGPVLPRKRGRKAKSVVIDISPEATNTAVTVIEDNGPPVKRRKVNRTAQAVSIESTPTFSSEEHTSPQRESTAVQKWGSQKSKAPTSDGPTAEVLSDGQGTSAAPSQSRKRTRNVPNWDVPAHSAPSITPESSVEPSIPKKKGGRPRKNSMVGNPTSNVSVKAENTARMVEPLITRARSSGQDTAIKGNLNKEPHTAMEAADTEQQKGKRNWGGKRTKGVFTAGHATKSLIAFESDMRNGIVGAEDDDHVTKDGDSETGLHDEREKDSSLGTRNRYALQMTMSVSDGVAANATDLVAPLAVASRSRRLNSKPNVLSEQLDGHDAEQNVPSYISTRPKRAATIAEVPIKDTVLNDAIVGVSFDGPIRPKRAATTSVATGKDMAINDKTQEASSNIFSRSKRAIHIPGDDDEDVAEEVVGASFSGGLSRPQRVVKMKISAAAAAIAENGEMFPNAISARDGIDTRINKQVEKKKFNPIMGHGKITTGANRTSDEDVAAKVESDNEESDSEGTRKEKKAMAAKASKAMKNSQSMKARWANGSMHEVMRLKKEKNLAKKAAAAHAAENGEVAGDMTAGLESTPASAPAKRKIAPNKAAARRPKRRRTMNATMDGPASTDDEYDIPDVSSSGPASPTSRRVSEYERYQQLSSPLRSPYSRRKRRPAALRASQSFSKFTDDGDEAEMIEDGENEDVETELKKQFDSEFEHHRALTPPSYRGLQPSNILSSKRKPKPVMNLAEAMRIEAGGEDDFFIEG